MCLTYKEALEIRANGRATQDSSEDKTLDAPVSLPEEGGPGRELTWGLPTLGVGRTRSGSRPGASWGGVTAKAPHHLPYMRVAGTDLQVV